MQKICSTKILLTMEKYMFIFLGGDPSHLSPQAQEAHMQKWFAWVDKLTKANRYIAGEALIPGGKTIAGPKKVVTDGPYAERAGRRFLCCAGEGPE
jgi:hypothetical protein